MMQGVDSVALSSTRFEDSFLLWIISMNWKTIPSKTELKNAIEVEKQEVNERDKENEGDKVNWVEKQEANVGDNMNEIKKQGVNGLEKEKEAEKMNWVEKLAANGLEKENEGEKLNWAEKQEANGGQKVNQVEKQGGNGSEKENEVEKRIQCRNRRQIAWEGQWRGETACELAESARDGKAEEVCGTCAHRRNFSRAGEAIAKNRSA
jgi:hypothetical protein